MTVIAWDGKTLAVDRKVSGSKISTCKKLYEHEGARIAFCGTLSAGIALKDWYIAGANPETFSSLNVENTTLVVVTKPGELTVYEGATPYTLTNSYEAFGTGEDYARAAMYLGKDAIAAVEVANALDDGCGNGVDWL